MQTLKARIRQYERDLQTTRQELEAARIMASFGGAGGVGEKSATGTGSTTTTPQAIRTIASFAGHRGRKVKEQRFTARGEEDSTSVSSGDDGIATEEDEE